MITNKKVIWVGLCFCSALLVVAGCNGDVDLGYDLEDCNFTMDIEQSDGSDNYPIGYAMFTNPDGIPECLGVYATECSGSDCDQMYETREECEEDMNSCIQDVLDHNCNDVCHTMYNCYDGDLIIEDCIDACTDQDSQEVPYLCAESAECISSSTCDEIFNQDCGWYSDCIY